jgi:hypothetical protein
MLLFALDRKVEATEATARAQFIAAHAVWFRLYAPQ